MTAVTPEDGKYYLIKNVSTGTYPDLSLGKIADDTPIVGFRNLTYNNNRKWKYINKGSGEFELENGASKTYAAHDKDPKDGSKVYGHSTAKVFRLISTTNNGYNIRVKDKDLTWYLSDSKDGTQLTLSDKIQDVEQAWNLYRGQFSGDEQSL
ncbi:hypothetical protein BYT27DRAFT_7183076 [Phlegmacium glaucopus]|nr:hypothetical protein BYT27DRAFT_7183076 [Phlegmacium glaucopus]